MNVISDKAIVCNNVLFGNFIVLEDEVEIGDNCIIGNHVIIKKGTQIGSGIRIDDNVVIGKQPLRSVNSIFNKQDNLQSAVIKNNCLIGTGVIIYCGCIIGEKTLIADLATVRENVVIGNNTIIGRGVAVENYCQIGSFCKLETNSYITAYSILEDNVFIAPGVVTSNDNYAGRSEERFKHFKGVTVKKGARIGAQATILPGKTIHNNAFAAAGSIVTKDVEQETIVAGNPAKYFGVVPVDQRV